MRNLPGSIRLFLLSIPIFASILVQSWKSENSLEVPGTPSFLELRFPSFQEKYLQRGRFSSAVKNESRTIGQWIAANMGGRGWSEEYIQDLSLFIVLKSREYRLSPYLVVSLIQVESSFDPKAVSPKGAVGLMQLMPATAKELAEVKGIPYRGTGSLMDPKLNIYLGLHYMSMLRSKFPDHEGYLTAYNIGPTALARKRKAGVQVSLDYYEKVMDTMSQFQKASRKKGKISWL